MTREAQPPLRRSETRIGSEGVCKGAGVVPDSHTYSTWDKAPFRAGIVHSSMNECRISQKLKMLPLTWFY